MRSSSARAEASHRRAQPWLGTFVVIECDGERAIAEEATTEAFAAIAEVHRAMSAHDPASELSRLNCLAPGESRRISPALARVLRAALALAEATDGRFDPTVGGALVARGRLPAPNAPAPDHDANWRDVVWRGPSRVEFRRRVVLDLGGIAKGYAVDRALERLRRPGVRSAIVNAGGDLKSFGRTHTVAVRHPADPQRAVPALEIRDAAVATSAGYFSERDGDTDLVDTRGGDGLGIGKSVTVCARRAIWADALTKVVLADPAGSRPLLERLGASAWILDS